MNFSIKKKLSTILLLSSFLSNGNDNSLASAFDDINYKAAVLTGDGYNTMKYDDESSYKTLNLDEDDDLEEALVKYNSDLFRRQLITNWITVLKTPALCWLAWRIGELAGSGVPEIRWASKYKQAVIKEVLGNKTMLEDVKKLYKTNPTWSEIKQNYQKVLSKQIDDSCTSENELAFALMHNGQNGFLYQIKSPWAPLGLQGPIFARKGTNVKTGGAYNLPKNEEELVNISDKVRAYFAERMNNFYNNLTSRAGAADTIKILGTLETLLGEFESKSFSKVPKALESILELVEDLLPVLHLFYSISDNSTIGKGLNWGLGFSPRIPVIREENYGANKHEILTTSDYYKSILVAGDRKGTIEIDLSDKKIGQKMGMNLYSAIRLIAKTGIFQDRAAKLYSKSAESDGNVKVFSELCGNLKNIISSVRKLLEDNKNLISKLLKTLNGEVFKEIDANENYITNLFGLKTGLKETLLGILNKSEVDKEIAKAEEEALKKPDVPQLDEEQKQKIKEEVINKMEIKRINKECLTEAIKQQLPDLPVFREIGEFFIDKFFDECGFEYEGKDKDAK